MAKTRSYGKRDILNWKFEDQNLPKAWMDHLGELPGRFHMYVDGDGGHGKTEYMMQLTKMLSNYMGKVHVNNVEQGKHKQIQQSYVRNNFETKTKTGKWIYSSINNFEDYRARIKRVNSGKIQVIDSISYWPLNAKQIQDLISDYKSKSFIFVGYKAHFNKNKPIAHMCDIKVRIEDFKAYPSSRYGGNQPFDIWPDKNKKLKAPTLFDEPTPGDTYVDKVSFDEVEAAITQKQLNNG